MKGIKVFFGTLLCLAALALTAGLLAILLLFPSGKTPGMCWCCRRV